MAENKDPISGIIDSFVSGIFGCFSSVFILLVGGVSLVLVAALI